MSNSLDRQDPLASRRALINTVAMLVYLVVVYAWSLNVWPLGRDYAALASRGAQMPFGARHLFSLEMDLFGAWPVGYHVVNLALLYVSMVLIYHLVGMLVRGAQWLGTLAAVLFMANPMHSEAVLNISAVADLLPFVFALGAVVAYVKYRRTDSLLLLFVSLGLFSVAVLPSPLYAFLVAIPVLYELLIAGREKRRALPVLPFLAVSAVSWFIHAHTLADGYVFSKMFTPLYFIFYPIGFLPETARAYHESPWLGWLSGAVVLGVAALICRAAGRRVIVFGLLSMGAVRLFQGYHFIDPVHMTGAGVLLLPNVFFNVSLVALFQRIMSHPKWRKPVVMLTTFLCLFFFSLEIRSIRAWTLAGDIVRTFQSQAAEADGVVGVLPDYQRYAGAPIELAESVRFDTPFSRQVSAISLLPIHYSPVLRITEEAGMEYVIQGRPPVAIVPYPYELSSVGGTLKTAGGIVETLAVEPHLRLRVNPDVTFGSILPGPY